LTPYSIAGLPKSNTISWEVCSQVLSVWIKQWRTSRITVKAWKARAVMFGTCISEVPGSNLGSDGPPCLSSFPLVNSRDIGPAFTSYTFSDLLFTIIQWLDMTYSSAIK
jgi:hypothetical protein